MKYTCKPSEFMNTFITVNIETKHHMSTGHLKSDHSFFSPEVHVLITMCLLKLQYCDSVISRLKRAE